MRSHEERIAEVRRRIAEKERQKRRKQRRIVAISCIAACLAVIVGVSFVMPGIVGQIEPGASSGFETAATIGVGIIETIKLFSSVQLIRSPDSIKT